MIHFPRAVLLENPGDFAPFPICGGYLTKSGDIVGLGSLEGAPGTEWVSPGMTLNTL